MQYLGVYAREQGLIGAGEWWHFGANDDLLGHYKPHAHIPIRHPLSVAKSWAQRVKPQPIERIVDSYRRMFSHIDENECVLYRIEDLPRLAGTDDHPDAPDESPMIERYQNAVMEHVIDPHRAFFARFYLDLKEEA